MEGTLIDTTGVISKPADPGPYGGGGLMEWIIPNPKAQVRIDDISGLNPEWGNRKQ